MVLDLIADFSEMKKEDIVIGLDGCGVPVFGMPLDKIALCYLNLVRPARMSSEVHREAAEHITRAMAAYPEMLFGDSFFATELSFFTGYETINCHVIKAGETVPVFQLHMDASDRAAAFYRS